MSAVEVMRLFFLSDYEEKRNSSKFFRHASFIRLAALASMAIALSACQEDVKSEQTIRPVKAIVVHQDSGEVAKSFSGDSPRALMITLRINARFSGGTW